MSEKPLEDGDVRVAKFAAWSAVVLIGLLVVLIVILLSIDVTVYRGPLQSAISTRLGRQVTFAGEMSLSPSLRPKIVVEDVRIANPSWASRDYLLRANRIGVQVALLPLLQDRVELLDVDLEGLDLQLEVSADGSKNWTFLERKKKKPKTPGVLPEVKIKSLRLEQLVITYLAGSDKREAVTISDAHVTFARDQPVTIEATGRYRDTPFSLSFNGGTAAQFLAATRPWPVEIAARIGGAIVDADGLITRPLDEKDFDLRIDIKGEKFADLSAFLPVDLPALGSYAVTARVIEANDRYRITGLSGHLGDEGAPINLSVDSGKVALSATEPIELELSGRYRNSPFTVTGEGGALGELIQSTKPWPLKVAARVDGAELNVEGTIAEPKTGQGLDLQVDVRGKQFKELEAIAGRTLPALGSYRLAGRVREQHKGYLLTNLEGHIGDRGVPRRVDITKAAVALPQDEPVSLSIDALYRKQRISVSFRGGTLAKLLENKPWPVTVSARAADTHVKVEGTIAQPLERRGVDLKVNVDGTRLALLGLLLGTELPSLQSYKLSARVVESVDGYTVRDLKGQMAESDVAGTVAVQLDQSRLGVSAELRSSNWSLKQLLATRKKKPTKADKAHPLDFVLPVADLRRIDADLDLSIGRISGGPVEIRDLATRVRLDNGHLTLEPVQVALAGLSIQGRIGVDARKEVPSVALELSSRDVDIAQVLRVFAEIDGFTSKAEGLNVTFKGAGENIRVLLTQGNINASASGVDLAFQRNGSAQPVALHIASIDANARHGGEMRIAADAVYREVPINLVLSGESLSRLMEDRKSWPLTLSARTGKTSLVLKGDVTWPIDTENFTLALALKGESVDQLDPLLKTRLPPYGPYVLSGQLERKSKAFSLSDLDAQIGLSHLKGKLAWSTAGPRPEITAEFEFDPLHLERAIEGLTRKYGSADEKIERDLVLPEFSIPVDTLRSIDLDFDLRATEVLGAQTDLGDVKFKLFLKNGRLAISPFEARLSGGEISTDLQLDASKETPTAAFLLQIKHLDYGTLLKELGVERVLEARSADFDIRLVGEGATLHSLLGSANGRIVFVSGPADFAGADPLRLASLTGMIMTASTSSQDNTQLNCMVWPFEITGGVARSELILIDMPRYTIGGSGTIDLATDKLKMVFRPRPKSPRLMSLAIPVEVKGSMMKPEVDTAKKRRRLTLQIFVPLLWIKPGTGVENPCVEAIASLDPATGKPKKEKKQTQPPDPFGKSGGN
ncbi:MAG: AsmA family protein [Acidiferrobacterales bacterium]